MLEVRVIELALLVPDPNQPRQTREELEGGGIEELTVSIRRVGVRQPIIVEPNNDGTFTVKAGERRYHASRRAGKIDIPCIIVRDSADAALSGVVENLGRRDLNPIDEANTYRGMMEGRFGGESYTIAETAEVTGKTVATINNRLKLLDLPEEVQEMVRYGRINLGTAVNLAGFRDKKKALERARRLLADGEVKDYLAAKVKHPPKDRAELCLRRVIKSVVWSAPSMYGHVDLFFKVGRDRIAAAWATLPASMRGNAIEQVEKLTTKLGELVQVFRALEMGKEVVVPNDAPPVPVDAPANSPSRELARRPVRHSPRSGRRFTTHEPESEPRGTVPPPARRSEPSAPPIRLVRSPDLPSGHGAWPEVSILRRYTTALLRAFFTELGGKFALCVPPETLVRFGIRLEDVAGGLELAAREWGHRSTTQSGPRADFFVLLYRLKAGLEAASKEVRAEVLKDAFDAAVARDFPPDADAEAATG